MGPHGDRPSLEMYQTIDPLTKRLLNPCSSCFPASRRALS